MGDVLMNLPAVRLLRQTYPKAWITFLADDGVAGLLKGHEDIDEVLAVDTARIKNSPSDFFSLAVKLKKIDFDLCLISNPDKSLHALSFFAGIPCRVGHDRKCGFFLNKKLRKNSLSSVHEIEKNLSLARLVSEKSWDGRWSLPLDPQAVKNADDLLSRHFPKNGPLIAVHAGTSNPEKRWPVEHFAELCGKIGGMEKYSVVLVGGEEEKEISAKVARLSQSRPVDFTGALTLRELAAFFNNPRVKLLVSADSGPVHVAWIQKTPVVALYAKNCPGSDPARWGPLGPGHEVIHKNINEISVDEVYEKVRKILH